MKIITFLLSSSFLTLLVVFTCTIDPNTCKCFTLGFLPLYFSYGVTPSKLFVADQFWTETQVFTASAHNLRGSFLSFSSILSLYHSILLRWVRGSELSPYSILFTKKTPNSSELNSPLWSNLKHFFFSPVSNSARLLNRLKNWKVLACVQKSFDLNEKWMKIESLTHHVWASSNIKLPHTILKSHLLNTLQ